MVGSLSEFREGVSGTSCPDLPVTELALAASVKCLVRWPLGKSTFAFDSSKWGWAGKMTYYPQMAMQFTKVTAWLIPHTTFSHDKESTDKNNVQHLC